MESSDTYAGVIHDKSALFQNHWGKERLLNRWCWENHFIEKSKYGSIIPHTRNTIALALR